MGEGCVTGAAARPRIKSSPAAAANDSKNAASAYSHRGRTDRERSGSGV